MSSMKRICDLATIGLFLGALCLPFWDEVQRPASERTSGREFRTPARAPLLPGREAPFSPEGRAYLTSQEGRDWLFSRKGLRWMTRYPGRYQAYHTDGFGFRDLLVTSYCEMAWQVFGVSPLEIVYRGKDDWVFMRSHSEQAVWRGALPFTEAELSAWTRALRARRAYFAERGIEYLFCVAPDKANVYPEFTPSWAEGGETRLEQLEAFIGDENVGLVSLKDAVVAEKVRDQGEDLTIRRLGGHWTDRGAKAGTDAIVERLRRRWPSIQRLPLDRYDYTERFVLTGDDIGEMLHLKDDVLGVRREFGLDLQGEALWEVAARELNDVRSRSLKPGLPKAWIQHDSFGVQLRPFLLQHLGDSQCVWGYGLDLDRIDEFGPEIVIELVVERALNFLSPTIPHDEDDSELGARFARSTEHLVNMPARDLWSGVSPNDRTALALKPQGLGIHGVRLGAGIWLPPIECPPDRDLIVRLDLTVKEADELRLVYLSKSTPNMDLRRGEALPLKEGRNEILFELLAPELTGRIFVIPFAKGRGAILHSLEVRAVAH